MKTVLPAFVLLCGTFFTAVHASAGPAHRAALDNLVSPAEKAFLLEQPGRIDGAGQPLLSPAVVAALDTFAGL